MSRNTPRQNLLSTVYVNYERSLTRISKMGRLFSMFSGDDSGRVRFLPVAILRFYQFFESLEQFYQLLTSGSREESIDGATIRGFPMRLCDVIWHPNRASREENGELRSRTMFSQDICPTDILAGYCKSWQSILNVTEVHAMRQHR